MIRALRHARNSVRHNWSAALEIGLGPDEFLAPHATVFGITWVDELTAGRPDRKAWAGVIASCQTLLTGIGEPTT